MYGQSKLTIKPNSNVSNIRRKIGKSARERKRESQRRRRRLEKLARWVSGREVEVNFQSRGAKCQPAPDAASHELDVFLPTDEHDQPATDLDPAVWDFVFQKAELVHELGHVLYTDFDSMEEYVEKIGDMWSKQLFKNLFNIVEDGAIERQLASDFNVGNDLRIKNENLMLQGEPGNAGMGDTRELEFRHAVETILMDWAKFNTGRAEKMLDPANEEYVIRDSDKRARVIDLLPTLREMMEEVVTEPDGEERVAITYEYFRELEKEFEAEGEMGLDPLEQMMQAFPDDAEVHFVVPGDPPEDAESLEVDEDDEVIILGDPGDFDDDGEEDGEQEIEAQYGSQVEADDEGDSEAEDLEKWVKAVDGSGVSMEVAQSGNADPETWTAAMDYAKKYERELKRVLQAEKASRRKPNERAGRPDVQSLWKLGYGSNRVFERETEPEDKDYSAVLILDRSGSMMPPTGNKSDPEYIIDEAEAVTIGMAKALENLGAEVAILAIGGEVYMEKPFGVSVEAKKETLARGKADDGTPLGASLKLAQERLQGRDGQPLIFAVTDGFPSDDHIYQEALENATFPVAGAYFGPQLPDESDIKEARQKYHRLVTADTEGLSQKVEAMIKRLVV